MFDLVLAFPVHSVPLAHPRDGALIVNCSNDGMSWNKELGKIKESRGYIQNVMNTILCIMKYFSFSLLNKYVWLTRGEKLLNH